MNHLSITPDNYLDHKPLFDVVADDLYYLYAKHSIHASNYYDWMGYVIANYQFFCEKLDVKVKEIEALKVKDYLPWVKSICDIWGETGIKYYSQSALVDLYDQCQLRETVDTETLLCTNAMLDLCWLLKNKMPNPVTYDQALPPLFASLGSVLENNLLLSKK